MNSKGYIRYLIYLTIIFILLMIGGKMTSKYYNDLANYDELSFIRETVINLFSYGGVGVVLGIENLFRENKKEGRWRFDFKKVIIVGVPSLMLSLPIVWAVVIIVCLNGKINDSVMTIYNFVTIFNIIFGYILITSIYREEERHILEFRNLIKIN